MELQIPPSRNEDLTTLTGGDVNHSILAAPFPDTKTEELLFTVIEKPLSIDIEILD